MNIKEEPICRLCLNVIIGNSKEIEGITRHMLEFLLLQLDLDISRNPLICQDCQKSAEKCLHFKSICLNTEKNIFSFCLGRKKAEFDIKDIYAEIGHVETVVNQDLKYICRFCMTRIENTYLDVLTSVILFRISESIPELDLDIIKNPLICTPCKYNLEYFLIFVHNCLDIEKKIRACCQEGRTNSLGQVKLGDVLHFSFKSVQNYPDKYPQMWTIKQEFEATENVYPGPGLTESQQELENNLGENSCKNLSDAMLDKCTNGFCSKNNDNELKSYKCLFCAYRGKQRRDLTRHMLIHKDISEIQKYKCLSCVFETIRKHALVRHMLIHKDISEVVMYKCSLCAYQTKHKVSLTRHMLVHKDTTEIEMHECSQCSFKTKRKSYLKTHSLTHKDVSDVYKCCSCPFETKNKHTLKSHMYLHKDRSIRT